MVKLDFSPARVLVVGDLMLDQYWHGATDRVSPEAPVPIVHVNRVQEVPGGAANVALNLAVLKADVTLMGLIGLDAEGQKLKQILSKHQIKCILSETDNYQTTCKLRILSRAQQLIRLDTESTYQSEDDKLLELFKAEINHYDILILADYNKGALNPPQAFIEVARAHGIPVLVDPKKNFSYYQGADIITPNLREFESEVGPCSNLEMLIDKARMVLDKYQLKTIVVTRAEQGMSIIQAEGEVFHLSAQAREVFDITGAGDTVIACMGAWLAIHPEDILGAANLGNLAAGLVVAKSGTASVSPQELEAALHTEAPQLLGYIGETELLRAVRMSKAQGERIVFTNGCFDMLHLGHVSYLEEARALGDRLIVAVNTDESIKRLKGNSRPIHALDARARILAALRTVDWVVAFEDDTPERLISLISPHIMVKGGDYKDIDALPGAAHVQSHGGLVKILSLEAGISTTLTIEKILKAAPETV